jgi:hypothetical protein
MKRKWTSAMLVTANLQVNNGSGFHVSLKDVAAVVNRTHGTNFTARAVSRALNLYDSYGRSKTVLAKIDKQDNALLGKLAEIEAKATALAKG